MTASQTTSRSNLRQGAAYVLAGLLWGVAVPVTPFPRLALVAHVELVGQGAMFLVAGLLITHLGLGSGGWARRLLVATPWLGWPAMLTEMANAWWGSKDILAIAARQAGAPGALAWQETLVMATHVLGAACLFAYWVTILAALLRNPEPPGNA